MQNEPRPMREIHKIREKIYEEQKNMSDKERLGVIHKEAEEAKKKWGLKLLKPRKVDYAA